MNPEKGNRVERRARAAQLRKHMRKLRKAAIRREKAGKPPLNNQSNTEEQDE